tara:strand:+ start:99 stop:263 length:165 start_codon:yes stop_codon:yes gene_type:complete
MDKYNYYDSDEDDGSIEVVPSRKDITLKYKNKVAEDTARLLEKIEKNKTRKKND